MKLIYTITSIKKNTKKHKKQIGTVRGNTISYTFAAYLLWKVIKKSTKTFLLQPDNWTQNWEGTTRNENFDPRYENFDSRFLIHYDVDRIAKINRVLCQQELKPDRKEPFSMTRDLVTEFDPKKERDGNCVMDPPKSNWPLSNWNWN